MLKSIVPAIFWLLAVTSLHAEESQNIMVSPGTLVLADANKAGVIIVAAGGDAAVSIEAQSNFFIQNEEGQLKASDPLSAEKSAAGFLRVGPRKFTLTPGRGQEIRVSARPPKDLAPGEYRLHLIMTNRGSSAALPQEVAPQADSDQLSVVIPIRIARGVRVLYRHQVTPEGGRLENLALSNSEGRHTLSFDVARLGATTLMAQYHLLARDAAGNFSEIGQPVGVNIYPENPRRSYSALLDAAAMPAGSVPCVRLTHKDPGNPALPAETQCLN